MPRWLRIVLIVLAVLILLDIVVGIPLSRAYLRHLDWYKERIADPPVRRAVVGERVTSPEERKVTHEGRRETIGEGKDAITVLYLKGSFYEMGYQRGVLMRNEVRESVRRAMSAYYAVVREEIYGLYVFDRLTAHWLLDDAYTVMTPYIPDEYKQEMEGLADGSGVPLKTIQRIHAIPCLGETSCSGIAAMGDATEDGRLYQVRVLDYFMEYGIQDYAVIAVYQPDEGNAFADVTWAPFVGVVSGMNEKGVALSEMSYGGPGQDRAGIPEPQPEERIDGIPMHFLLKDILRLADDVEQATDLMRDARRTNYYIHIVGDGITSDGVPQARGYISTSERCDAYVPGDPTYPIPPIEDVIYASRYNDRCRELLEVYYGRLNPRVFMDVIIPAIAMDINLCNVVYDPAGLRMWVANAEGAKGRACNGGYVEFNLGEALARR